MSYNNLFRASTKDAAIRAIMPAQGTGMHMGRGMDSNGIATSMAFLVGELEKQDPRIVEPMTSLTAPRDIDTLFGGGWVDFTSNIFADYATTGNQEDSLIGSETSNIPIATGTLSKDIYKTMIFGEILQVKMIDQAKLQQIGRSLDQILDTGLRLNFNKIIDQSVYVGITKYNTYGLVNSPQISAGLVAQNAGATSRLWTHKTPTEIMADINGLINAAWATAEYAPDGIPNHILVDPANFTYICNTPVTSAGTQSILNYLLDNNIAKQHGVTLEIVPSRWCIAAGAGSTQRIVAYVKDVTKLNMDQTVPLTRLMTAPDVSKMAFLTAYGAQFSQVKFLFSQCAAYGDGV